MGWPPPQPSASYSRRSSIASTGAPCCMAVERSPATPRSPRWAACVGPLLPLEAFDDPAAVRARLAALRAGDTGRPPLSAACLPEPDLRDVAIRGSTGRAELWVPGAAPFFADHFPRRAVYPATLLAEAQNQLARPVAARALGAEPGVAPAPRATSRCAPSRRPVSRSNSAATPPATGRARTVASEHGEGKRIASGFLEYRVRRQRDDRAGAAVAATAAPAPPRVLVKAVNWLGDLVMSLPALRAVRRAYPVGGAVGAGQQRAGELLRRRRLDRRGDPLPRRPLARRASPTAATSWRRSARAASTSPSSSRAASSRPSGRRWRACRAASASPPTGAA